MENNKFKILESQFSIHKLPPDNAIAHQVYKAVLADSKISIFAVSTFNTDYLLVETANIKKAKQALIKSGYIFEH